MSWQGSGTSPVDTVGWKPQGLRLWPTVIVVSAMFGVLAALWPAPSVAALLVLALMIAVMASREFALDAILVSSLVTLGAVAWLGLPSQTGLLTKALAGLFVLGVVLDWTPESRLHVPVAFIMLLGFLVVSALFGNSGRLLAAQALGAYLVAPVAYIAIVHSNLDMSSLRRVALLILFIIIAQVPLMVIQSRFVGNVDDIGGTFGLGGSTQMLAIVFGIAWTIAVALLTGRRAAWLIPIGITIGAALMISQSKAGFLFAAMGTVVVGVVKAVSNPRRGLPELLMYFVLGAAAVATLFGAYVYLGPILPGGAVAAYFWVHWLSNPAAVMNYLLAPDPGGQAGRLGGTLLALTQARTTTDLLIGHGPGLLSGSALGGSSPAASSAIGFALSWATSLTRFLLEVGVLGILLYIAAVGAAIAAVSRAWRSGRGVLETGMVAAAAGAAAVYIAGATFHAPWTTDAISVPFWCLMGMAVRWGHLRTTALESTSAAPSPDGE